MQRTNRVARQHGEDDKSSTTRNTTEAWPSISGTWVRARYLLKAASKAGCRRSLRLSWYCTPTHHWALLKEPLPCFSHACPTGRRRHYNTLHYPATAAKHKTRNPKLIQLLLKNFRITSVSCFQKYLCVIPEANSTLLSSCTNCVAFQSACNSAANDEGRHWTNLPEKPI